jgi:hypothetical protein
MDQECGNDGVIPRHDLILGHSPSAQNLYLARTGH